MEWHQFKQSSYLYLGIANSIHIALPVLVVLLGLIYFPIIANLTPGPNTSAQINFNLACIFALIFIASSASLIAMALWSYYPTQRYFKTWLPLWGFVTLAAFSVLMFIYIFISMWLSGEFHLPHTWIVDQPYKVDWDILSSISFIVTSTLFFILQFCLFHLLKSIEVGRHLFYPASFLSSCFTVLFILMIICYIGQAGWLLISDNYYRGEKVSIGFGLICVILNPFMGIILFINNLGLPGYLFGFWQNYDKRIEQTALGKIKAMD